MKQRKNTWVEDWKVQFITRIGEDKRSLRSVTSDEDMPSADYIYREMERDDGFALQYARACEDRADGVFEEILEIADDATNDYMDRKRDDGTTDYDSLNSEHVQRSKLRIDARKWMLGKMNPSKYSDKLDIDLKAKMNVTIGPDDTDL